MKNENLILKLKGLEDIDFDSFVKSAPVFLGLDLSGGCPLKCSYCFVDNDMKSGVTTKKKLKLIEQASDLGIKTLFIAGVGEPLISPEFSAVISKAYEEGLTSIVYTCGWDVGRETAEEMLCKNVYPIVKVESLNQKIHDGLTGRNGSLDRALSAMNLFEKIGFGADHNGYTNLGCASLYTSKNLSGLKQVRNFCIENGIRHFIDTLGSYGRTDIPRELFARKEDIIKVKKEVEDFSESLQKHGICKVWKHGLYINLDGYSSYCGAVRTKEIGNVNDNSLDGLYKKKDAIFPAKPGCFTCINKECDYG